MDSSLDSAMETQELGAEAFAQQSSVLIFTSTQYDKFTLSDYNRDIKHHKKLIASIKENDFTKYAPILVDKNLVVVDGQGRFCACRELELPINFVVSDEIQVFDAPGMNSASTNWGALDYIQHYAKRGEESYIRFLDICHTYNQSISVVSRFGHTMKKSDKGSSTHSNAISSGKFKFREEVNIEEFFEHMKVYQKYYSFSKQEKFVSAVLRLYMHKDFNREFMENKLKTSSGIVNEQPKIDLMAKELLKLYNYNNKKHFINL